MAYNKSKHVEAAQKYLHQGKIAQAVSEYQVILRHEPKDQVTLMTVGDLFVRQGETFQALEYFERLAQLFLTDGFLTKAIAIYKKIAKLAPEEVRPVEKLADLYVQQGVLSEARPIYLQLAEMHHRAHRPAQAAALLRKLLEAEPDNLRVQTRLAELSMSMGQPAEAAAAFRSAGLQLQRHGDHAEAIKYADRALKIDSGDASTVALRARSLAAAGQRQQAVTQLESLPDLDVGGEAADLLIDLHLEAGQADRASALASKIFGRDASHYAAALRVASALLETSEPSRAVPLLDLIRGPMTAAGEHERLSQLLMRSAEQLPGRVEPREWLVELYGHTSDSFRLPDALATLAETYEAAGQHDRALQTYAEIIDRDPDNEVARRKHEDVQARLGVQEITSEEVLEPLPPPLREEEAPPAVEASPFEAPLDEDTRQFISQALTDVDLFSSYGLTQKAMELLEVVLQRAPQHTPTLERLLDMWLGLGDDHRTAELASQLEQIHRQRGDTVAADRFAELQRRFGRAAAHAPQEAAHVKSSTPPEFTIPVVEAEPEPTPESETAETVVNAATESAVHEVDLSEEWAALVGQAEESAAPEEWAAPPDQFSETIPAIPAVTASSAPVAPPQSWTAVPSEPAEPSTASGGPTAKAPSDYELDLEASPKNARPAPPVENADSFFQSLSAELDALLPSLDPAEAMKPEPAGTPSNGANYSEPAAADKTEKESRGPLGDVFDEFRAELGETAPENEDLETHYNLGIAYREMGLTDEAISEFQRVAKANHEGRPFRYAMQCYTLLGLAFMEKGQPSIAAMWYERALQTQGLDAETILALRYDLGIAQETAGDTQGAHTSFSQVYGVNIDYRDVAERLAALGKVR